ncbi:hypothetical protein [Niabella ginsengisoli]|uniref:Uncharacterized protein n=1 Tax=Niabella ginsengisoli TaxID=522298 RepID=A0ABS9SPJ5_9BACT|nr:hypothetical protein [Niabella ginsengisoli]MCH5600272.1 hypothetical protein [Niabella ginsengisoli]
MKILLPFLLLMVMIGCKPKQQNAEQTDKDSLPVLQQTPSDSAHIIQNIKNSYTKINNDSLPQKSFHWENDTTCAAPPMVGTVTFL